MYDSSKQLNILFLASWYPNKIEPQNGNFIQRHAEAVALNCRVAVLHVLSIKGHKDFEIEANWNNNVFEVVVYFDKTSSYFPIRKIRRYLKAQEKGYDFIVKEMGKIDLVHLNVFFPAGIFALRLKRRKQIPFVITEHWTAFLKINPYKFNWFENYFIKEIGKEASMICPVSEDLRNAINDFGIDGPFQVIPNVVDTMLFKNNPKRNASVIKILHVSTLYDQHKNVSGFLNVIKKLQSDRSDFKVTLAGNKFGDLHFKNLERLEIKDGLVDILEEIPIAAIAELMQEHHIFVLFSNYENLPCVISEAHASGMVVIATDVGGVREMIDDKNGALIPAKDETALYQELQKAMNKLANYDSIQIRDKAVKRYSYQSVGDQYLKLYQSVLKS